MESDNEEVFSKKTPLSTEGNTLGVVELPVPIKKRVWLTQPHPLQLAKFHFSEGLFLLLSSGGIFHFCRFTTIGGFLIFS